MTTATFYGFKTHYHYPTSLPFYKPLFSGRKQIWKRDIIYFLRMMRYCLDIAMVQCSSSKGNPSKLNKRPSFTHIDITPHFLFPLTPKTYFSNRCYSWAHNIATLVLQLSTDNLQLRKNDWNLDRMQIV